MVDGPVPDTAMNTKSEEGEPGEPADATPLTADEQAMLDRLRDGDGGAGEPVLDADTGPPAPPADGGPDPLDPVFREPSP